MIGQHRVVALVPVRAGSKGIPGKNLRPLAGRPLLGWAVDAARRAQTVDRVVVSTDGDDLAAVARQYGAEVLPRPAALAGDDVPGVAVVRHTIAALRETGEDAAYLVLLQATSPFTAPEDVDACVTRLHAEDLDAVTTLVPARVHPARIFRVRDGVPEPWLGAGGAVGWQPRQALDDAYELSGSAYAIRIDALGPDEPGLLFGRTGAVLLDPERWVDIDDERDLRLAELIAEREPDAGR